MFSTLMFSTSAFAQIVGELVQRNGLYYERRGTTPITGTHKTFTSSGGYYITTYKDGIKEGPYYLLFPNGQLQARGTYKDGKFDGPFEGYYENGQLRQVMSFKDGKFDGPFETYYENGQLLMRTTMKGSGMDGLTEGYNVNGRLMKKCFYEDGKESYCE